MAHFSEENMPATPKLFNESKAADSDAIASRAKHIKERFTLILSKNGKWETSSAARSKNELIYHIFAGVDCHFMSITKALEKAAKLTEWNYNGESNWKNLTKDQVELMIAALAKMTQFKFQETMEDCLARKARQPQS